jgi:hypothetical protein
MHFALVIPAMPGCCPSVDWNLVSMDCESMLLGRTRDVHGKFPFRWVPAGFSRGFFRESAQICVPTVLVFAHQLACHHHMSVSTGWTKQQKKVEHTYTMKHYVDSVDSLVAVTPPTIWIYCTYIYWMYHPYIYICILYLWIFWDRRHLCIRSSQNRLPTILNGL